MINANEAALLAIAEVKTAYLKGSVLLGVSETTITRLLTAATGPIGIAAIVLTDWGKSENAIAIRKDYEKLGADIDLWATRDWQRAVDGDPKFFGGTYTWDDWAFRGNSLIAAVNDDVDLGFSNHPFNNYIATLKGIAADTVAVVEAGADAAKGALGWLPWVFGSLAVVTGGIIIYEVAKSAREISKSAQTVGDEFRLTARTAGGAARRRFNGVRR